MTKKKLTILGVSILAAVVFMLWPEFDGLQDGDAVQTGIIEISNNDNYKHDVFFPKRFASPPRVEISLTKGSGHLEIIETRTDGFVFKISNLGYSVVEGAYVQWVATGKIAERKEN
jgi:hypothetical protein